MIVRADEVGESSISTEVMINTVPVGPDWQENRRGHNAKDEHRQIWQHATRCITVSLQSMVSRFIAPSRFSVGICRSIEQRLSQPFAGRLTMAVSIATRR
jgi:hypothetical protein